MRQSTISHLSRMHISIVSLRLLNEQISPRHAVLRQTHAINEAAKHQPRATASRVLLYRATPFPPAHSNAHRALTLCVIVGHPLERAANTFMCMSMCMYQQAYSPQK